MPRLFIALPVPDEIADELVALQAGVPDARWVPAENFHVTLCFAGEVHGAVMRDLEEELSDIAGPRFPNGAETGHHIAQFMASHSTFRTAPWVVDHFTLYSSRLRPDGAVYRAEATYDLTF